jgi:hypothetical protein
MLGGRAVPNHASLPVAVPGRSYEPAPTSIAVHSVLYDQERARKRSFSGTRGLQSCEAENQIALGSGLPLLSWFRHEGENNLGFTPLVHAVVLRAGSK